MSLAILCSCSQLRRRIRTTTMPVNNLYVSLQAVGYIQGLILRAAKTTICEIDALASRNDSCLWHAIGINNKHGTETRMTDEEAALLVHCETIGASVAKGLKNQPGLGRCAIIVQREPPHRVLPGHGDEEKLFVPREDETVWRYAILDQGIKLSVRAQSVHFAGLIRHASLSLVRKVDIVLGVNNEVIGALEPFQMSSRDFGLD